MPTHTTFSGRMTRPAEDIGNPVVGAKFSVAVENYDFGQKKRVTEFYECALFGQRADVVRNYGDTGKHVWCEGVPWTRTWVPTKGIHAGHETKEVRYIIDKFELLPDGKGAGKGSEPEEDESGNAW